MEAARNTAQAFTAPVLPLRSCLELDGKIERGYLEPQDRDDREALADAVTACFSDAMMTP